MSAIAVRFGGDHPLTVYGYEMSGYHRPLGGEVANLTVRLDREEFFPDWLAVPPLGLSCAVSYAGVELMAGYLYGVRVTAEAVELRVEG